jgi:hypothetical protein
VAYPDDWYSNAGAGEDLAPCWLFAPADFEVIIGTDMTADVAVVIRRFDEWDYGPFDGVRVISDEPAVVDGLQARRQEIETTERTLAFPPGHRRTRYIIELSDGTFLVGETYIGPDYESARVVLDDMMRTLVLVSP